MYCSNCALYYSNRTCANCSVYPTNEDLLFLLENCSVSFSIQPMKTSTCSVLLKNCSVLFSIQPKEGSQWSIKNRSFTVLCLVCSFLHLVSYLKVSLEGKKKILAEGTKKISAKGKKISTEGKKKIVVCLHMSNLMIFEKLPTI
jgi:hypothetical protein